MPINTIIFFVITRKFKITVLKTVELPGSVAHLDASLPNVDADHLPLVVIILILIVNNIISKRHENLQHVLFLGGGKCHIPSVVKREC